MKRIGFILSLSITFLCITFGQRKNDQTSILIIQPCAEDGYDTYIASNTRGLDANYGNVNILLTMGWTDYKNDSPEYDTRILINFPILSELTNLEIVSAKLILYEVENYRWADGGQAGENASILCRITKPWHELEVTWNTQPEFTTDGAIYIPQNNDYDSIVVNITPLVKINNEVNYGFIILQASEKPYGSMVFCSSDNEDPEKRPKLIIEYKTKKKRKKFRRK